MNITGLGNSDAGQCQFVLDGGTVINGGNAKLGAGTTGATGALGATTNALGNQERWHAGSCGFSDAVRRGDHGFGRFDHQWTRAQRPP